MAEINHKVIHLNLHERSNIDLGHEKSKSQLVRERKGESPCESGTCKSGVCDNACDSGQPDEARKVVESNVVEHFKGFLVDHGVVDVDGRDVGHEVHA